MRLLLTHDGTPSADAALTDFRRAGLPDNGKALILWSARACPHEIDSAARAAKEIQTLLPQWEVSLERAAPASAELVLRTAAWWNPDLLMMNCGKHTDVSTASLVFEVVHRVRCSIRVVTPSETSNDGPIRLLLADDGSAGAQSAVRMVAKRSWPPQTEVRLLAAGSATLSSPTDALQEMGLNVSRVRIDGDACRALVQEAEAWNSDSVFLGAHGTSAANRFLLGSVPTGVMTRMRRTVEVVR